MSSKCCLNYQSLYAFIDNKQIHIDELQLQLPHTKILLVDGEIFSWYGSRLLKATEYFSQLRASVAKL